ncbi:MAG: sialidase family protein [Candidatus Bathyarchaeia archaeon]
MKKLTIECILVFWAVCLSINLLIPILQQYKVEAELIPSNSAIEFGEAYQLTKGEGIEWMPRAFQDSRGTIWVVYFSNPYITDYPEWAPEWSIEYLTSNDGCMTWDGPKKIFTWEGRPVGLSITEDHLGRIWVVWDSLREPCGGNNEIYYSISEDRGSTWSYPSKPYESYAPWNGYTYPSVIEAFDKVWIFFRHWMGDSREGILCFTSEDEGLTWSNREVIVDGPQSEDVAFAYKDSEGKLWLLYAKDYTWAGPKDIWYKTTIDGVTWSEETQITSSPFTEMSPTIVEDVSGRMCIFYWRIEDSQCDIWYSLSLDRGITWTDPISVTYDPNEDSYPTIVAIGKTLILFWQSNRSGSYDIWYKKEAPQLIQVSIDIKPGSYPNSINPNNKGVIPVAILNDGKIDLALVNVASARFGPNDAKPVQWALEDVDGDGDIDIILHFKTQDTGIKVGDTLAALKATLTDGTEIIGTDSIRTVPPKK